MLHRLVSLTLRFIAECLPFVCGIFLLFTLLSAVSAIGCVRHNSIASYRRRHRNRRRSPEPPPPKVEKSIRISMHCTADTNVSDHITPTTVVGGVTRKTSICDKSRNKMLAKPDTTFAGVPVIVTVDTSQKAAARPTTEKTPTDQSRDEANAAAAGNDGTNEAYKTKSAHDTQDKPTSSEQERKRKTLDGAATCVSVNNAAPVPQQVHQSAFETPAVSPLSPTMDGRDECKSRVDGRYNDVVKTDRERARSSDANARRKREDRAKYKVNGGRR